MECFIVSPADVDGSVLTLRGDEAHHAVKSLRLREGDELLVTNLEGTCYECRIALSDATTVTCAIEHVLPEYGEPQKDIMLIQAMMSQPARWEFLLEKATELGVTKIQPVITERTEQRHLRLDRAERVLRAAVKQTKRARLPELLEMTTLSDALHFAATDFREILLFEESAEFLFADVEGSRLALVIGPEGGLTSSEILMAREQFGAHVASLGNRRLRAETAAIAALAIAGSH
jgi:16S rRNA (uracil1498-N3)-methyltransferase